MKRLLPILLLLLASGALAGVPDERCEARVDVSGLPLVELPASKTSDRFAIMLSGDGGWRRIDTKVTDKLRAEGVPVVGFLAPDYFAIRRTPEESACALERVIRYYKIRWHREKVLLIGYSRGADVLPFMAARLPSDLRDSIQAIALLGLQPAIDFRYHPSWIPFYHPREIMWPVKPELEKLRGEKVICFYGAKEKDSLCHALDPREFTIIRTPGGHHFAGKYHDIAETILIEASS